MVLSKPNQRGGHPIRHVVVGVCHGGKVFLHRRFQACRYAGFNTVLTPLTMPKTGVLVKNGYVYSGYFVQDRVRRAMAEFSGQGVAPDIDYNDYVDTVDFKALVRAIQKYLKTSVYATPIPPCEKPHGDSCIRKCGKWKHCDPAEAERRGVPYSYSQGACFVYNWGSPPFTYEVLLRREPSSFVQVYPPTAGRVALDVGRTLQGWKKAHLAGNGHLLDLSRADRDTPELVLFAVAQNGAALAHASDRLKDDPDVVLAAVQQNGAALQYASRRLQKSARIIQAARH